MTNHHVQKAKGHVVQFQGSLLNSSNFYLAQSKSSLIVSTPCSTITGVLYFASEDAAVCALNKIHTGELVYIASSEYLMNLPVEGGMEQECTKLEDLGLIGMDWTHNEHNYSWGKRKTDRDDYEPLPHRQYE